MFSMSSIKRKVAKKEPLNGNSSKISFSDTLRCQINGWGNLIAGAGLGIVLMKVTKQGKYRRKSGCFVQNEGLSLK